GLFYQQTELAAGRSGKQRKVLALNDLACTNKSWTKDEGCNVRAGPCSRLLDKRFVLSSNSKGQGILFGLACGHCGKCLQCIYIVHTNTNTCQEALFGFASS